MKQGVGKPVLPSRFTLRKNPKRTVLFVLVTVGGPCLLLAVGVFMNRMNRKARTEALIRSVVRAEAARIAAEETAADGGPAAEQVVADEE